MRGIPKFFNRPGDFANGIALGGDIGECTTNALLSLIDDRNSEELLRVGFASIRSTADVIDPDSGMKYNLVFEGDSQTNNPNVAICYPQRVTTLLSDFGVTSRYANIGLSGDTVFNFDASHGMLQEAILQVDPLYDVNYENNIAVIYGGQNDLGHSRTASQTYADIQTWCAARRLVGFKTIVLTSSNFNWAGAWHADFNNLLIADDCSSWDALADSGSDPRLQDWTNLTYFNADMQHLVQAGHDVVAEYVRDAILSILV